MAGKTTRDAVMRAAEEAIASGMAGGVHGTGGRLLEPVPVHSPAGEPAGWFVPVAKDDTLLGFIQLDVAGHFRRSSMFPPGAKIGIADWLDAATIRHRARAHMDPEEDLGEPILSYDGHPDRLAWLMTATRADGRTRRVFVAGSAVWTAPDSSSL